MKAQDVMTPNPACCTPDTSLRAVAILFVHHDCGAIPIVEDFEDRKPVGIVTDRDIACRAIAAGKNALELRARDCMSSSCVSVPVGASLDECCRAMRRNQVRRLVVVNDSGQCVGVIAQADLALQVREKKAAGVLREVSRPTRSARRSRGDRSPRRGRRPGMPGYRSGFAVSTTRSRNRSFPRDLIEYTSSSASLSMDSADSGATRNAMAPTEKVSGHLSWLRSVLNRASSFLKAVVAASTPVSGSRTQNSSPPSRATMSVTRRLWRIDSATSRRMRSPS